MRMRKRKRKSQKGETFSLYWYNMNKLSFNCYRNCCIHVADIAVFVSVPAAAAATAAGYTDVVTSVLSLTLSLSWPEIVVSIW